MYRIIEPGLEKGRGRGDGRRQRLRGQFRRAYYDGDYTTLDLSRDERTLFDKEEWLRAEEELQASLVEKLAERIVRERFRKGPALRQIGRTPEPAISSGALAKNHFISIIYNNI